MLRPRPSMALALCTLLVPAGCTSTGGQLGTLQTQNRGLLEQSKTQLAEIENLKSHAHRLEDKLMEAEEHLASLEREVDPDAQRLVLAGRKAGSTFDRPGDPVERLTELAADFDSLSVDPRSGTAQLDADSLFESGDALLRSEGEQPLRELAKVLRSSSAGGMKIMVVGHTDDQKPIGRGSYADNWELSAARALAVASYLQEAGVAEEQMGVAGFGSNQPLASNQTSADRRKNRRIEVHIVGPDTPVVGWIQSAPARR